MEKINAIMKIQNCKISFYEDRWHISGLLLNREDVKEAAEKLDKIGDVTKSHFYRVVFGETDPKQETENVSVSTAYDIAVGVRNSKTGQVEQIDTALHDVIYIYRGDLKVKVMLKVIEHTEKGKKNLYLIAYPQVMVLPEDWEEHLFNPFDGM